MIIPFAGMLIYNDYQVLEKIIANTIRNIDINLNPMFYHIPVVLRLDVLLH